MVYVPKITDLAQARTCSHFNGLRLSLLQDSLQKPALNFNTTSDCFCSPQPDKTAQHPRAKSRKSYKGITPHTSIMRMYAQGLYLGFRVDGT